MQNKSSYWHSSDISEDFEPIFPNEGLDFYFFLPLYEVDSSQTGIYLICRATVTSRE